MLDMLTHQPKYCPAGYFDLSLTKQIDVQVRSFLPDAVQWIEAWLDALEDPSFKTRVHVVQYESFVEDEGAYFDSILEFCGIDRSVWSFTPFTPNPASDPLHEGELHFRNARADEWRDAFATEQIAAASEMLPERQILQFGWPRR